MRKEQEVKITTLEDLHLSDVNMEKMGSWKKWGQVYA